MMLAQPSPATLKAYLISLAPVVDRAAIMLATRDCSTESFCRRLTSADIMPGVATSGWCQCRARSKQRKQSKLQGGCSRLIAVLCGDTYRVAATLDHDLNKLAHHQPKLLILDTQQRLEHPKDGGLGHQPRCHRLVVQHELAKASHGRLQW